MVRYSSIVYVNATFRGNTVSMAMVLIVISDMTLCGPCGLKVTDERKSEGHESCTIIEII